MPDETNKDTKALDEELVRQALNEGSNEDQTEADEASRDETARAAVTAVRKLKITPFLKAHEERIFTKLEECDGYASNADFGGDMMFIALALPVINGIIHVASTRDNLEAASDWVVKEWGEGPKNPEKVPILSALTLIYVVAIGWDKYEHPAPDQSIAEGKKVIWERILNRVQKLSSPAHAK